MQLDIGNRINPLVDVDAALAHQVGANAKATLVQGYVREGNFSAAVALLITVEYMPTGACQMSGQNSARLGR